MSEVTIVEDIKVRVRSTRRISSVPLIVVGTGVAIVALSPLASIDTEIGMIITPVASIALWLTLKITGSKAGAGMGRERYGLIVGLIALAAVATAFPLTIVLGPAFFLGVMLFAVGWRAHDPRQWKAGAIIAIASALLSHSFLQNLAYAVEDALTGGNWITRLTTDNIILFLTGLSVLALGAREASRENAILRTRAA